VNPNSAAMIAITRNIAAHFNMFASIYPLNSCCSLTN